MDNFHFSIGMFIIFIWKWEGRMQRMMSWISYNFAKLLKKENYMFQYAFTTDEENRLEYIFWSPTNCFDWYKKYGNVVDFYTTYKVNVYNISFGIFVGVNNHENTILFSCALLQNEITGVFQWLMKLHSLSYKFVQLVE